MDNSKQGYSEINLGPGTLKEQLSRLNEEQLQQIISQANQFEAFVRQMQFMDGVARDMRVIPELPSETVKPKNTNTISKVEFPEEGGVLTFMDGFEHPFQGYPHHEFVDKIDGVKKFSRQLLSGFYHQLKGTSRLKILTLLPALWLVKKYLRAYVYTMSRLVERFLIFPFQHFR